MVDKVKPWLWIPPHWAHHLGPIFLRTYGRMKPLQALTWAPFTWRDLEFTNPLGTAGGVDKDASCVDGWWSLGAGFLEVGTITPLPQRGHPGKVMDRNRKAEAVWNRLGFPSVGLEAVARRLKELYQPHFTPIFANIGKNKSTSLDEASRDYIKCIEGLNGFVDAFVLNISSPNTEGLRQLLKPSSLRFFLEPIVTANIEITGLKDAERATPLLLKISPDISLDELGKILEISLSLNINGWILTNTTMGMRDNLGFPQEGGVSGRPLAQKARELLTATLDILGDRRKGKLIVSTGGVMSPSDVFERLQMGADLVQVYSALVFSGPWFFRDVAYRASLTPEIQC
ncbi:MAG: quinone-dependent dihydroorotate dehydrogenase [Bdellovibrionales bacterium]|nr:quinone-dependent dihydroorotate dehydrogenase [Bdellovibrionales bacterium]